MALNSVLYLVVILILHNNNVFTQDMLINTSGCRIQNYDIRFKESEVPMLTCGVREVNIRRVGDGLIQITSKKKFDQCCYRYILRSNITFLEDKRIVYTSCVVFKNNEIVSHNHELINVKCKNKESIVYDDVFAIAKPLVSDDNTALKKVKKTNNTQPEYNVLMIGMDSMSRKRAHSSLNGTVNYFKRNGWLDFQAFNKIDSDSYSNLMAILTGSSNNILLNSTCTEDMYVCNSKFIWDRYQRFGYATAFGEDSIHLKGMFHKNGGNGFSEPPTDHYLMPLFLAAEAKSKGPSVCTKRRFSGLQILDYVTSLAESYKKYKKWFGFFWINSFSHDLDQSPQTFDAEISHVFKRLQTAGILDNTFVIFFSTQGVTRGPMRYPVESYIDEMLPMLFMHVPEDFKGSYKYFNLEVNQFHLMTPYDLHLTLRDILRVSSDDIVYPRTQECPRCTSMLHHIPDYRSCSIVGIRDVGCSCHEMTKTSSDEHGAVYSVLKSIEFFNDKAAKIPTKRCTTCKKITFQGVLRIHSYFSPDKTVKYYVTVFDANGKRYESTIRKTVDPTINTYMYDVVSMKLLSKYNNFGHCTENKDDEEMCICEKVSSYDCLPQPNLNSNLFLSLIS